MKNFQRCDRVSIVALALSVFFAVAAFLPSTLMPLAALKGYLVIVTILVAFVAWLLARLIEGTFRIPWTPLLGASLVFVVVLLISAFFSHTPYLAFFGEGFDQGTFAVLGSLFLGLFLASVLFTSGKRVLIFLKSFFALFIVLGLFQLVHVIFPGATTLSVFSTRIDSPVGAWSDFAFISGAVLIGSMLMLQFAKLEKKIRIVLISASVLALFFVVLANILVVWILVGFSAITILVYTLILNRFSEKRNFPFLAFILSLIALLFVLANSLFGGVLANYLHAAYVDVHPSFQATVHTSLSSLAQHPIVGAGPNRFMREWLLYRPSAVNVSSLWDAQFSAGSSLLATIAVLSGGLGILACILFLLAFGYESTRKLFSSKKEETEAMPIFGLFIITLYFLLSIIFFAPGIAVTTCAFICIGILIGSLVAQRRIPVREINFLKDQRSSFFSILCIVALLMISAGVVYAATEHSGAIVFYEKSLVSAQKNELDAANTSLSQAIRLVDLPTFERTRVLLAEQSIQQALGAPAEAASADAIHTVLQNAISTGNTAAQNAISLDQTDPGNYIAMGDLMRLIVPLKVDGVVAKATDSYTHAIALAPNYPKSYLSLAELYFDSGDNTNARVYVEKALDQKSNYTDAFFLLAQIEVSDGNTTLAIKRIQDATLIDPNNPDIYFELGVLRYNSGDYANALNAFNTTIGLNNQYLNAWFYRALTEQKTGAIDDATDILTKLHATFPDNQAITSALNGTTSVNTSAASGASTKQEKAKKLPLPSLTDEPTQQSPR